MEPNCPELREVICFDDWDAFIATGDDKNIKGKGPQYPTTGISPSHHAPYWRVSMDVFRFHLTQYRTYIEKLQSLYDEQLEKLAGADQDSWSTPVELVFGKSLVQGTPTGDVFEAVARIVDASLIKRNRPFLVVRLRLPVVIQDVGQLGV